MTAVDIHAPEETRVKKFVPLYAALHNSQVMETIPNQRMNEDKAVPYTRSAVKNCIWSVLMNGRNWSH